jgi:endonuclease/exonuclease/phosphatase family metal-dependent hydrolase
VVDIVRDIITQDPSAPIVVCGDFNNHLPLVTRQLAYSNFAAAFVTGTETHNKGGHLDQIFVRNIQVVKAFTNDGYDDMVTDHKCLRVTLRFSQQLSPNTCTN